MQGQQGQFVRVEEMRQVEGSLRKCLTSAEEARQKLEERLRQINEKLESVLQTYTPLQVHRSLDERVQSESDNSHQFEVRLNKTLEERLQAYSAQLNQSFQTIPQLYTPIGTHQELDSAVAKCVPMQIFADLQKHVENIQARLNSFDVAFTDSHNEVVQFQAQLVAKMEDIVVQSDEHNQHAAAEREGERNDRIADTKDLRELFAKEQAAQDRKLQELLDLERRTWQQAVELESTTRARDDQELDAALRRLINESLDSERRAWQQAVELESTTRARDDHELDAALRRLINESLSHEAEVRNGQLQEMSIRFGSQASDHNNKINELFSLQAQLAGSHQQLEGRHDELSKLQSSGFRKHSENMDLEHEAWTRAFQEMRGKHDEHCIKHQELVSSHGNLEASHIAGNQRHLQNCNQLQSQLEELLGRENTERNAQIQDVMRRLDSLMAAHNAHEGTLASEHKAKEEQFAEVRNAIQNLAKQDAEEQKNRCNAIDALAKGSGEQLEGLRREFGSKCANLKEEFANEQKKTNQQVDQTAANNREQMAKMCEGAKAENAKKISIVQGSINGLQTAQEADRMAFREAREEQMRNLQNEREARNRQNAEIRADYKREIVKEHQERLDDAADQRKDMFKLLRGGGPTTGVGTSLNPNIAPVDGPVMGPGPGSGQGIAPAFASLDALPELDKKQSINSLGKRLSLMGSISPKPSLRCPPPES